MSVEAPTYLDSSALVKLVLTEPESDALAAYLGDRPNRVSCALARVEVARAAHAEGDAAIARARELIDRVGLLRLDDALLDKAATLGDETLRSLDAIHLAAAITLGDTLGELVTYDRRMAGTAHRLGISVAAPG